MDAATPAARNAESSGPHAEPGDRAARPASDAAAQCDERAGAAAPAVRKRTRRLPRREKGTRWDDRYAYALVLWAVNPAEKA